MSIMFKVYDLNNSRNPFHIILRFLYHPKKRFWSRTLTFPKKLFYLLQLKTFKNDEKYILFNLKSYFRSLDI